MRRLLGHHWHLSGLALSVLPPGPLRIVALVVTVGLTWIVVSILLGGPGHGFPRIQQLFISKCGTLPCLAVEIIRVASWACGVKLRVGVGFLSLHGRPRLAALRLSPGTQHSLSPNTRLIQLGKPIPTD